MITCNYIEYLKNSLEPDEGYPHKELYEWSNKYIEAYYVQTSYASSALNVPRDLCTLVKNYKWKDRYCTLVRHGTFFDNIIKLDEIRRRINSEEDWRIELDLKNIPYEMANFEICYCWMNPGRLFSYDWRILEKDVYSAPPFPTELEADDWIFVDKMYKKISREHLPICTVEEFMEMKI